MKVNSILNFVLKTVKWCAIAAILFCGDWVDVAHGLPLGLLFLGYVVFAPLFVMLLTGQFQRLRRGESEPAVFSPKWPWILKALLLLACVGIIISLYRYFVYWIISDDWYLYFLDDSMKFFFPPLQINVYDITGEGSYGVWRFLDWVTTLTITIPALIWLWDAIRGVRRKNVFTLLCSFLYSGFIAGATSFRYFISLIDLENEGGLEVFYTDNYTSLPATMLFISIGAICTILFYVFVLRRMKNQSGKSVLGAEKFVLPVAGVITIAMSAVFLTAFQADVKSFEPDPIPEFVDNTPIKSTLLTSPPELVQKERPNKFDNNHNDNDFNINSTVLGKQVNDYAFRSSSTVLANIEDTDNAIYSPITSFIGLSMLAACTEYDVSGEILECLGLDLLPERLDYDISELLRDLYIDDENGSQILANSLWIDEKTPTSEAAIMRLSKGYQAAVYETDFDSHDAQDDLNTWIRKSTKGMVNGMAIPPLTKLMMGTALFFDGGWSNTFNSYRTETDKFTIANGDKVNCEFMYQEESCHSFIITDHFSASYLSFSHGAAMHFILPSEGVSIQNLLNSPSELAKAIDYDYDKAKQGTVDFKVPKLDFTSELDMDDVAKKMGIRKLFEHASVAGIDGKIIDDIVIKQSNAVSMDEYGVRAASVSISLITILGIDAVIPDHLSLELDRPFLFVITSPEGYILFMGVVNDPSQS